MPVLRSELKMSRELVSPCTVIEKKGRKMRESTVHYDESTCCDEPADRDGAEGGQNGSEKVTGQSEDENKMPQSG